MLLKIVAWFYLISGVICLIKPGWLQAQLKRKSRKKIKRVFLVLAFTIGGLIIKGTWGMGGVIPKILCILGIIGIFKGMFFWRAKASDAMIEWWSDRPVQFYRLWSVLMMGFGVFLLYLQ